MLREVPREGTGRPHRIATLFGEVRVKLPRLVCAGRGCGETGVGWPSHCRSTPELNQLQARLSALMPYRVATDVLQHLPCQSTLGRALRQCAAIRYRSASSSVMQRRISRQPPRQSRSAWIQPSSAAAGTANATWRSRVGNVETVEGGRQVFGAGMGRRPTSPR